MFSNARHAAEVFENLEPRLVLSNHLTFEAYYPEGYASDAINEFVPITNHNNTSVEFELHARYEFGQRDTLIASGVIPPQTRGGVTISEVNFPLDTIVRKNVPYALVLKASAPLSATISHYDFGTAIGESFTTTKSTEWTFAEGRKKSDEARDFILVFNPSSSEIEVQIEIYREGGANIIKTITLGAERRGGWAMNDIAELGDDRYSARITAPTPIVAAQSRYEFSQERGFGAIGTPDGGSTDGIVPAIEFDDDFYDINGDDSHRGVPRYQANAFISILNTNTSPAFAVVTLSFVFESGGPATQTRTVVVNAGTRQTVNLRDYNLPLDEEFGVIYRSTIPVTVSGTRFQGMDAVGVEASTIAATVWDFGEGYMSLTRGGTGILEEIYVYNPQQGYAGITLTFMFTDSTTLTVTESLDPGELDGIKLHRIDALRLRANDQWYGVRVSSTGPVVAMLEHWDNGNGGGFGTFGMPSGTIVPFGTALTLPGLPNDPS